MLQWPILMKHLKIRNLAWRLGHRSEGTCKVTWSLGDSKLRRKGPKLVWAFKLLQFCPQINSTSHKSTRRNSLQILTLSDLFQNNSCRWQKLGYGTLEAWHVWHVWEILDVNLFSKPKIERKHFFCWIFVFFRIWGTNCVRRSWAPWASTSTSAAPTRRWLVSVSVAKLQAVPVRSCTPHGNM